MPAKTDEGLSRPEGLLVPDEGCPSGCSGCALLTQPLCHSFACPVKITFLLTHILFAWSLPFVFVWRFVSCKHVLLTTASWCQSGTWMPEERCGVHCPTSASCFPALEGFISISALAYNTDFPLKKTGLSQCSKHIWLPSLTWANLGTVTSAKICWRLQERLPWEYMPASKQW